MNAKTSIRIAAVVLLSAGTAFYLLNRSLPIHYQGQTPESVAPAPHILLTQTATNVAQISRSAKPAHAGLPVSELAPRTDEVREEVRKNPEGTPPSLVLFASRMSQRFQIAKLSQSNAMGFFEELSSCLDPTSPIATTAKAFCLSEGERLAHYYPVLRNNYDVLALKASPEVRNLALHGRVPEKFSR
jgi:hypothetical protein